MHRLDAHQPLTSSSLKLVPGDTLTQSFFSHYNNLDTVSICLRNTDRFVLPLTFSLTTESGTTLRKIPISTGNIDNQDCTKFQFAPITDSAKHTFIAKLDFSAAVTPLPTPIPTLTVESHTGSDYTLGSAHLNMIPTDLDLHFKTFYYQSINEVVKSSLSQLTPRFAKDIGFSIFWLLTIGYLVIKLIKRTH